MTTKAGTWAPTQEEADRIEAVVDRDERWEQSLAGKEEFINRPLQPPGLLRSGTWAPSLFMWCGGPRPLCLTAVFWSRP